MLSLLFSKLKAPKVIFSVLGFFLFVFLCLWGYTKYKDRKIDNSFKSLDQSQQQADKEIANKDGQLQQVQKQINQIEKKIQADDNTHATDEQLQDFFNQLNNNP